MNGSLQYNLFSFTNLQDIVPPGVKSYYVVLSLLIFVFFCLTCLFMGHRSMLGKKHRMGQY